MESGYPVFVRTVSGLVLFGLLVCALLWYVKFSVSQTYSPSPLTADQKLFIFLFFTSFLYSVISLSTGKFLWFFDKTFTIRRLLIVSAVLVLLVAICSQWVLEILNKR